MTEPIGVLSNRNKSLLITEPWSGIYPKEIE
jgi:hypothetical protein